MTHEKLGKATVSEVYRTLRTLDKLKKKKPHKYEEGEKLLKQVLRKASSVRSKVESF